MRGPSLISVLLLAGCASSALDLAPVSANRPWVPRQDASGAIVTGSPGPDAGAGFVLPGNKTLAGPRVPAGVVAGKLYGLPDLIDLAESENPQTRVAWNAARDAALAVGVVRSLYLPRLTVAALGGWQGQTLPTASAAGVSVSNRSTGNGTVSTASMQWLLFDFGQREALEEVAEQGSILSNIAFTAMHQQVIYDVTLAWHAYQAARARQMVATQALDNARRIAVAASDRLAHQEGTVGTQAQARLAVAQGELDKIRADSAVRERYLALLGAVGAPPSSDLRVAEAPMRPFGPATVRMTDAAVQEAVSRRPDVLGAYAAQKASEAQIRAAEAEFLPKVFASGNIAYSGGQLSLTAVPSIGSQSALVNLTGGGFGGTVVAGITLPVFDGGTREALLQQARLRADSASQTMAHKQDAALRQIVLADSAVHSSIAAMTAATALVTAAQTNFDAALTAYRSGVGDITAMTAAQTALLQAQLARTDAWHAAATAAATLAFATGTLGGT